MAQFEIFIGRDMQHHWRFKANNGEIVAQSEAYTSKAGAQNGIKVIQREAAGARVYDLTAPPPPPSYR